MTQEAIILIIGLVILYLFCIGAIIYAYSGLSKEEKEIIEKEKQMQDDVWW